MAYSFLENYQLTKENYELVSIREKDAEFIRNWRNDQIDVLRQKNLLSPEDQENYFKHKVFPSFTEKEPNMILVSILKDGELIGYGGLVYINWVDKRAEISFLVETCRARNMAIQMQDFDVYLSLITKFAFNKLNFNRLTTETFAIRLEHIGMLEKHGFKEEGRLREHVWIQDKFVDSVCHALLNKQYQARKQHFGNILISSLSGKFSLLSSLREAAYELGIEKIYGGDTDSECPARLAVDDFWLMPSLQNLKIEELVAYCIKEGIEFIIPTRDGELLYYAEHAEYLATKGIHVMVSNPEAIRITHDKMEFYRHLSIFAFPVIETVVQLEAISAERLVIKEREGAGSRSIKLNITRFEAEKHSNDFTSPIYQPFIAGREFSADAYVDCSKKVKGIVLRWRKRVEHGESQETETFRNPEWEKLLTQVIESIPGLYGHLVLQAIVSGENNLNIIELNARFGGASALSQAAGLKSFLWFMQESKGFSLVNKPFEPVEKPLILVKTVKDLIYKA